MAGVGTAGQPVFDNGVPMLKAAVTPRGGEDDWLSGYLASNQAKQNKTGGVRNGMSLSYMQRRRNLRHRSWACPGRNSFEKFRAGKIPGDLAAGPRTPGGSLVYPVADGNEDASAAGGGPGGAPRRLSQDSSRMSVDHSRLSGESDGDALFQDLIRLGRDMRRLSQDSQLSGMMPPGAGDLRSLRSSMSSDAGAGGDEPSPSSTTPRKHAAAAAAAAAAPFSRLGGLHQGGTTSIPPHQVAGVRGGLSTREDGERLTSIAMAAVASVAASVVQPPPSQLQQAALLRNMKKSPSLPLLSLNIESASSPSPPSFGPSVESSLAAQGLGFGAGAGKSGEGLTTPGRGEGGGSSGGSSGGGSGEAAKRAASVSSAPLAPTSKQAAPPASPSPSRLSHEGAAYLEWRQKQPKTPPPGAGPQYSTDGKGLPLFKVWDGGQGVADQPTARRHPSRASIDCTRQVAPKGMGGSTAQELGNLEALRARLNEATQVWAEEDQSAGGDKNVPEVVKNATSAAAAQKVIDYQWQLAAERERRERDWKVFQRVQAQVQVQNQGHIQKVRRNSQEFDRSEGGEAAAAGAAAAAAAAPLAPAQPPGTNNLQAEKNKSKSQKKFEALSTLLKSIAEPDTPGAPTPGAVSAAAPGTVPAPPPVPASSAGPAEVAAKASASSGGGSSATRPKSGQVASPQPAERSAAPPPPPSQSRQENGSAAAKKASASLVAAQPPPPPGASTLSIPSPTGPSGDTWSPKPSPRQPTLKPVIEIDESDKPEEDEAAAAAGAAAGAAEAAMVPPSPSQKDIMKEILSSSAGLDLVMNSEILAVQKALTQLMSETSPRLEQLREAAAAGGGSAGERGFKVPAENGATNGAGIGAGARAVASARSGAAAAGGAGGVTAAAGGAGNGAPLRKSGGSGGSGGSFRLVSQYSGGVAGPHGGSGAVSPRTALTDAAVQEATAGVAVPHSGVSASSSAVSPGGRSRASDEEAAEQESRLIEEVRSAWAREGRVHEVTAAAVHALVMKDAMKLATQHAEERSRERKKGLLGRLKGKIKLEYNVHIHAAATTPTPRSSGGSGEHSLKGGF
eukprot:jgi/Mesen1/6904/ME000353S05929